MQIVAIVDNARRKRFQECTSFDELGDLCNQYIEFKDTYLDEIIKIMPNLTPKISDSFFNYLLKVYYLSNTTMENKSVIENGSINLLKTYCRLLVNSGILKERNSDLFQVYNKFIPLIIASVSDHKNIDISYLTDSTRLSADVCRKIFYDHEYDLYVDSQALKIIDILSSNAAYEDYVYDFVINYWYRDQSNYLLTRSKMIYNKYFINNAKIVDLSIIDIEDIYNYLTYLISSLELDQKNLVKGTNKLIFENAIRNTYDSIDMINLDIPISGIGNYKGMPQVDSIRVDVLNALIDEALIFMRDYKDLDISDLKKYFKINYDKNRNVTCYRIIPDSPLAALNKGPSTIATEAYDKNSSKMDKASRKIYSGYKAYKDAEQKVDSQISKLILRIKDTFTGQKSTRDKIVEGEQFSAIKILKRLMMTAAIFSYSKIAGVLFIITRHYCSKSVDAKERKALISELELEIKMLDEKIDDARGDGNRQAKYNLMRTRAELQKALEKIKYGLEADQKAMNTARNVLSGKKSVAYNGPSKNEDY